jgi:hypothetical protein
MIRLRRTTSSRGDRDRSARLESLGTGWRQVGESAPKVVDSVLRPANQVHIPLGSDPLLDDGVGADEVRRRDHVQPLPRRERRHLFVVTGHPGNVRVALCHQRSTRRNERTIASKGGRCHAGSANRLS